MEEVENSIAEFKRSSQEYDEDRVQEQVSMTANQQLFRFRYSFLISRLVKPYVLLILT